MLRGIMILVGAILLCAVPMFAQGDGKLDPEAQSSGSAPFDVSNLGQYSLPVLEAFQDAFKKSQSTEAAENAKKIGQYLATQAAAAAAVAAQDTVAIVPDGAGKTRAMGPGARVDPTRRPGRPGLTSGTRSATDESWYTRATNNMTDFWKDDSAIVAATGGTLKKGQIYDPATGQIVNLDEHTAKVGVVQSFEDELANTQSGSGGSMQRLK